MDLLADPYYVLLLNSLKTNILASVTLTDGRKLNVIAPSIMDRILPISLPRFAQAFTTEYYDMSDLSTSYEQYETLGDLFCNKLIGLVIHRHFPDLNQAELSNMLAYYKSNREFARYIGIAIPNINQLIRRKPGMEVSTKMLGDVFEALIYVTYLVVDETVRGAGDAAAENLFHVLSRGFVPDKRFAKGNPKSLVLQDFHEKKKVGRMVIEKPPEGRFFGTLTVTLPEAKVREVEEMMGINITTTEVTVHDVDRKKATTMAYSLLLERLEKDDRFTPEAYEEAKRRNIIANFPRAADVYAKEKALKEKVLFVKKSVDGMIDWRLVGVSDDTKKRRLIATETVTKGSEGFHIAKDKLLAAYVSTKK